jgi:hypothetical protein
VYERVPDELKALKRWMLWNYNSKGTKIPLRVGGSAGSSADPEAWSAFEIVVESSVYFQGIATVMQEPYTGVDLDNCFDESGNLRPWAIPIVARLDGFCYAEVSPSGLGIKFVTRARKPDGSRCLHKINPGVPDKQQIECYDHDRFWTVTGNIYNEQDTIGDGQAVIDWLCKHYLSGEQQQTAAVKHLPAPPRVTDTPLMQRAVAYVETIPGQAKGNLRNSAFSLSGHLHSMVDEFGARLTDSEVLDLLRDWNQRNNPPLKDDELKEASVNGRTNGTPRADKLPMIRIEHDPCVDLSGILNGKKRETVSERFPVECLEIPGLIGEVVKDNLATAHYPLPELALASALALMSSITGGKVEDRGARTNLFIIGLAPSGGGKDHGRKLNRTILREAGGEEIVGPERIGSHAGIVSAMAEQWNTLFQIDEIQHLAMAMQNKSSPHLVQISSVLMQVYSSADSIWTGDAYGDRKKVKKLHFPHLVLYGTSVPEGFWESMTEQNLKGGLIGRCLVFESAHYVEYQDPQCGSVPKSIVDQAAWWLNLQTHSGNLAEHSGGSCPMKIMRTEEAHERLHDHALKISRRRMQEDTIPAAIWSRAAEKTIKLALLFACSRASHGHVPTISLEDADRAIRLNNWITRRMLQQAERHVANTPFGQQVNEMRTLLRSRDGEWTMSEITRKTRGLKPRDRNDILQTLMMSGCIEQGERETNGRTALVFRTAE